jgi:hypothetical protein
MFSLRATIESRAPPHGAGPVGAFDRDVDLPALAGRDQLVDRGVDRCVLAPDPEPRDEAKHEEPDRYKGQSGRRGPEQVRGERDHEQSIASESVGQPPEEERAAAGADHVVGCSESRDLTGRQVQPAPRLADPAGDVADDRDLESIEDPDRAQADEQLPVPA